MMMADLKELTLENRDDIAIVLDTFPLTKEEERDVHLYSNKMFEQIETWLRKRGFVNEQKEEEDSTQPVTHQESHDAVSIAAMA